MAGNVMGELRAYWVEERGSMLASALATAVVLAFVIWTTAGRDVLRKRGVIPPDPDRGAEVAGFYHDVERFTTLC